MHRIFRYVDAEVLMIVGIVLCFFVTVHASDFVNEILKTNSERTSGYEKRASYSVINKNLVLEEETETEKIYFFPYNEEGLYSSSLETLLGTLKQEQAFYVCQFSAGIGGGEEPVSLMVCNTFLKEAYPLKEEYSLKDTKGGVVYVGATVLDYAKAVGDQYYLDIEGITCTVGGILVSEGYSGYDMRAVLDLGTCSKQAKACLEFCYENCVESPDMVTLSALSNQELEGSILDRYETEFDQNNVVVEPVATNKTENFDPYVKVFGKMKEVVLGVLYVFVFGNLLVITDFWVKRRERELLIRKTYGMKNITMCGILAKNLLAIMLTAVPITILIEAVLRLFQNGTTISLQYIVLCAIAFWLCMAVILCLVIGRVLVKYQSIAPASEL